ncbi:LysE family transporter [Streptomyces sp. NPDC051704]|uniref:LysE family transporter n=1 Tax=Streptomyces sp. NPDC051704 TaxID=3365671 RepID=UPI0037A0255E
MPTLVPGPAMAVVTKLAVSRGRAAGLLLWGVVTVTGPAALLATSAQVYPAVKHAGAAYLCFLGVDSLRRPDAAPRAAPVLSRARRFFARPAFGVRVATPP